MYCPSCGTEQALELSYCSRCGANLSALKPAKPISPKKSKSPEEAIETVIWSVVGVTITLLGIMVAVMALMIGAKLGGLVIVLFMVLIFLMMLGIDGLLLWQLSSLKAQVKEARELRSGAETDELGARQERVLAEPRMSVTEGTTRGLEPAIKARQRKQ